MEKKSDGKKTVRVEFVIDEKAHGLDKLIVSHKKQKEKTFTMGELIRESLSLYRARVTDPELIKKISEFNKAWEKEKKIEQQ